MIVRELYRKAILISLPISCSRQFTEIDFSSTHFPRQCRSSSKINAAINLFRIASVMKTTTLFDCRSNVRMN